MIVGFRFDGSIFFYIDSSVTHIENKVVGELNHDF